MSKTATFSDWLKEEWEDLKRMRDELRVQAKLGRAEMRDRREALERSFESFE